MFQMNSKPILCVLGIFFVIINSVTGVLNPQEGLGDQEPDRPCVPRNFGKGSVVCVCNSTYCDSTKIRIPSQFPPFSAADEEYNRGLIHIYTSTKTGSRLHKSTAHFNKNGGDDVGHFPQDDGQTLDDRYRSSRQLPNRNPRFFMEFFDKPLDFTDSVTSSSIPSLNELNLFNYVGDFPRPNRVNHFEIKRDVQYQKVIGIGGAFTDSAGINIAALSRDTQENLMRSYFGQDGNDYSMGRVPIGGTDFSTRPYTYDDDVQSLGGSDRNLSRFALQPEDHKLKIPYIQWAQSLSNGKLKLVASPWSAPAWMKTSNRIRGGSLKKEYYQQWADYFAKFLEEYKKLGIDIWGVTTGNEPVNGFIPNWPFNCMGWSAKNMREWIVNNLGPTLSSLRPQIDPRVIILDDNKGAVPTWAKEILGDGSASQYVDGVGTHWYLDFWTGAEGLSRFHKNYPDYFIVQTEACLGFTPWELEKVILGSWERGEQYLEAIIRDMKNWVGGWIDWNLALDLKGGPNWANLSADAAILVDVPNDEFFKQPIYYAIGHVSKFVPADSVRIQMNTITDNPPRNLQSVAFLRPDNGTVLVFLNKLNYDAKVSLFDEERGSVFLNIPAKSIQTLLYW